MRKTKVNKADGVNRDAKGRLKPGHHCGGRGSRRGAMTEAFADAGISIAEARRLVIEQTVANAKKGVDAAVERLARIVLPATRVTPGIFGSAATASERAAAVVAAVETGAITPSEAGLIAKGALEHLAMAEEWAQTQALLERAAANPPAALPRARIIHVDAGTVQLPRASASGAPVVDVEPTDPE